MTLQIIGDVHGKYEQYLEITKQYEYTLQLGDFGFNYDILTEVDHNNHKIFKGNHDPYNLKTPHNLGDFGMRRNIFFVRGAFSIDQMYRTPGIDWFPEEEIDYERGGDVLYSYGKTKPKIVVTHTAPLTIVKAMGFNPIKTMTGSLLEMCFQMHQPDMWIFGHFHKSWSETILGTKFVCLAELETYKL